MYLTAPGGFAFAVDARSGRQLWSYKYPLPPDAKLCCGTINRGLAILGDRLFLVTPDAHLVAIDSRTGTRIWDSEIAPAAQSYGGTLAPLAVKDKIVVGVAGGEWGVRGRLRCLDG
jgi:alcohol dehydrogenase (cytochrome c)